MSKSILSSVFVNTQNSYKFYWWLAIIEICFYQEKKEVYFDEIVLKIISKLWYPVNYYKLSFGKVDQCSNYVNLIKKKYRLEDNISEKDLYKFLISNKESELLIGITNELTRYVPFRFIRPWVSKETRGIKDSLVNLKILELNNEASPYSIELEQQKIIINSDWFSWINENFMLIKAHSCFELIKFLENKNPNVANISKKIKKPSVRNLNKATKNWKIFISKTNSVDVFQNKPLINLDEFSLDHFIPWSFTTHDLIWNLHPIERNVNSSKSNCLPSKDYLEPFSSLQYDFCQFHLSINSNKVLEDYYALLTCSKDDLSSISKEKFSNELRQHFLPQYEIAKNMGFESDWILNQF
tara:strand:+ start:1581 stop:2642 length:1062 start_codon:yes stop_codon:yes gene_type:complete